MNRVATVLALLLATPPAVAQSDGTCSETSVSVIILTDDYGQETSWRLLDSDSQTVAVGSDYASNTSYVEELCLGGGDYLFVIEDTYGDGICCAYGEGSYRVEAVGQLLASGSVFGGSESTSFTLGTSGGGDESLEDYYEDATGLAGYTLKSALHTIVRNQTVRGYGALWDFYRANELDIDQDGDRSVLDIYSENPSGPDAYTFQAGLDQCGNYQGEGDCYNREHAFPRSWFGGSIEPMNSDVHHVFPTDGYVNARRGSYPYGEVDSPGYVSSNGSRLGPASVGLGYDGTVFEPIDEYKGDLARAYFFMATRYEDRIANWQQNSAAADAALDGSRSRVFEPWFLRVLKRWHSQDPVSSKEVSRNNAAFEHQGNRNPFIDYPEFVDRIWEE
ncbi:MAG: endonuclease [Myxococcota bacterium]